MGREYYHTHTQWQLDRLAMGGERTLENSSSSGGGRYHHDQSSDVPRPMVSYDLYDRRPILGCTQSLHNLLIIQSIERALREQCRIPAQFYFVSAVLDSGEAVTFSGPTEYKDQVPKFFNTNRWIRLATGQSSSGKY